jgi:hypothetical protein
MTKNYKPCGEGYTCQTLDKRNEGMFFTLTNVLNDTDYIRSTPFVQIAWQLQTLTS